MEGRSFPRPASAPASARPLRGTPRLLWDPSRLDPPSHTSLPEVDRLHPRARGARKHFPGIWHNRRKDPKLVGMTTKKGSRGRRGAAEKDKRPPHVPASKASPLSPTPVKTIAARISEIVRVDGPRCGQAT